MGIKGRMNQPKRMAYNAKAGKVWNPMLKVSRNAICPLCESGKKFKKCCLDQCYETVNEKDVGKIETFLMQKGLL